MTNATKSHGAVIAGLVLLAGGCDRGAPELTQVGVAEGFASPESAYYDQETRQWFVSNVGEQGVPGDGFISRLAARGKVLEREEITGLDDPKGIRVHDGVLYVSDVTSIVRVPLSSPDDVTRFPVPDAAFLNDVAIDSRNGDVYVTDTVGNSIYRLRGDEVALVLHSDSLEGPNGLLVLDNSLVIASVGPDLDPATFTTSAPGRVLRLDLESIELSALTDRLGLLDGIERLGAGFLISDFAVGVYYASLFDDPALVLEDAAEGLGSSADIGLARSSRLIAVPDLNGTRVLFYRYEFPRRRETAD